jgi:hypothetical protein
MFERSTRITESDRKLQKKRTFKIKQILTIRYSLKMNNVELFVKFKNGRNRGNISEIRAKRASHQFIRKRREGGRAGGYWRER